MATNHEIARLVDGGVEVRPDPVRLRWRLRELLSSDSHQVECTFSCAVRALDSATEKKMLTETFFADHAMLTSQEIVDHFTPALRAAAERVVGMRPVEQWLSEPDRHELLHALREAGNAAAFSCGLEVLPPFEIELHSPSFRQQKLEQMQRQMMQQRTERQVRHLQRAVELLRQFEALRDSAPGIAASHVLDAVAPADRGSVLEMLLMARAQEQPSLDLWCSSGGAVVRISPREETASPQVLELPPTLGPLRSVQPAGEVTAGQERRLLAGARAGVLLVDPERPGEARPFHEPDVASALGFNRAVLWHGEIWASHGEAGLVGWNLDEPDRPKCVYRPEQLLMMAEADNGNGSDDDSPAGPRHLAVLDESRLIFSLGHRLMILDREGSLTPLPLEPRSEVAAIISEAGELVIVHEDGQICRRDPATTGMVCQERRGGQIRAAGAMPWLSGIRLLLATEQGPVACIGLEDQLVTEFLNGRGGMRGVAASAECVAAVSPDRQRLILWQSWEGRRPARRVYITPLTKHRITDLCFA